MHRLSDKKFLITMLSLVFAALFVGPPAQAIDQALLDGTSTTGSVMFANSGAPGLVIAVVRGDETYIEGFGETAKGNKTQPDGKSIVRLGSISKVFAGELFADLVVEGKVGLTDPLSKFAPDGTKLKEFDQVPVTLLDLATHSAGLPREAIDPSIKIDQSAKLTKTNPFDVCNTKFYWSFLTDHSPAYTAGTTAMYSNMGFGLLGEALIKAGGKPYPDLLKEHISNPLKLSDTVLQLTDEQRSRLMTGLDAANNTDANWPTPPIMDASGGLYSTADDMARWMRAQVASPATTSLAMQHAMWRPHDGLKRLVGVRATSSEGMALGWVVNRAHDRIPLLLSKSGSIGGFMTHVAISPNRKLGIFVAVNRVNFAMLDDLQRSVNSLAAELSPGDE